MPRRRTKGRPERSLRVEVGYVCLTADGGRLALEPFDASLASKALAELVGQLVGPAPGGTPFPQGPFVSLLEDARDDPPVLCAEVREGDFKGADVLRVLGWYVEKGGAIPKDGKRLATATLQARSELCYRNEVLKKTQKDPSLADAVLPKRPRGRPAKPRDLKMDEVEQGRRATRDKVAPLKEKIEREFQTRRLNSLAGKACPTFSENRKVVDDLVKDADDLGITLLCRDHRIDGDGQLHPVRLYCEEESISGKFKARLGDANSTPIYSAVMFPQLYAVLGRYDPSSGKWRELANPS